ncbi:TetR family transcriptional regulator [Caballeronia mineralivorans PML1(12)]|uniref:TetR family transcriptional regulator n=1 Tax=Caballeronia mineralivorans PML1(12) TaxID=908627 RepID=A0A0J1CMT7_9BURK|nr:TetR family transcriptional regulator [Caballeronia mineralivorans PML1(12)]
MDQRTERRPRGRPRAFDREAVLRRAMEVFWTKGFDGCSMNDLVDAMDINSPSIYAAFGSKENLFREAIDLYAISEGAITRQAIKEHGNAREAIAAVFKQNIDMLTQAAAPRGCMVILGTVNIGVEHEELRAFLQSRTRNVANLIRERLAQSLADGELAADADTEALATLCVTVLSGLSVQAHNGVARQTLLDATDAFVSTLPFTNKKKKK